MMMRIITLLAVIALSLTSVADADQTKFSNSLGTVVTDNLIWEASGAIPGSDVTTDTIVAGTLNDTTLAVDIGGAEHVAVEFFTQSKNDDSDFTVYAQVGNSRSLSGAFHTLSVSWSVDNTAGAQVGGTADTGRDTTLWLLLNDTMPDTVFTAQTGMTAATHGDQAYVRSSRFLRFWIDPDASAGDTTYVTAKVTKKYPR